MTIRAQKYRIGFPLNAQQAANIDEMFQDLYDQLASAIAVLGGAADAATAFNTGDILYFLSGATTGLPISSTAGTLLRSTGSIPEWTTASYPSTATTGDLIYASASNAYGRLADVATGQALLSGGISTAPFWGQLPLTTSVTGVLPVANGGTNATAFTAGSIVFAGTSGTYTQNNSNFFWDNTNGRLGIAIGSPLYKLAVYNSTTGTQLHLGVNADSGGFFTVFADNGMMITAGASYTSTQWIAKATASTGYGLNGATLTFFSDSGLTPSIAFTQTERMRMSANGGLSVGSTQDCGSGAVLVSKSYWLTDGITAPGSTGGWGKIYIDTADGDLKIIFGDGTIKTIVTD